MKTLLDELLYSEIVYPYNTFSSKDVDYEYELKPIWRMRPPIVGTNNSDDCWAACISSWSRVSYNLPRMTKDEVIERVKSVNPNIVTQTNGLRLPNGPIALRDIFGINYERNENVSMDLEYLGSKLKRDFVMIVFKYFSDPEDTWWHTVLAYGADNRSLCFMDPLQEKRRCEKSWDFAVNSPTTHVFWFD